MPISWTPSAEAFGTPTQVLGVGGTGISSAEAFGTADITSSSVTLLGPAGIRSDEAFGTLMTVGTVGAVGIPSAETIYPLIVLSNITTFLASGSIVGTGAVVVGQPEAGGLAQGVGALVDLGDYVRIRVASGLTQGAGGLIWAAPLPAYGFATLAAFVEVQRVPPPFCRPVCGCESCCGRFEVECHDCHEWHRRRHHREPWWWQCRECWERHAWHRTDEFDFDRDRHHREWSRSPNPNGLIGQFRWNHTFGRGDLEICIKDQQGNQSGPVFISYTMYMVSSTGILHQTGPTDRKPAQADVGKFYVTGTAGENGQPGCWAVKWRYQRTYGEPIYERVQQFRVLDAVLDCKHPDHLRRHCKYGWDL